MTDEMTAVEKVGMYVEALRPAREAGNIWASSWMIRFEFAKLSHNDETMEKEMAAFRDSCDGMLDAIRSIVSVAVEWAESVGLLNRHHAFCVNDEDDHAVCLTGSGDKYDRRTHDLVSDEADDPLPRHMHPSHEDFIPEPEDD